MYKSLIVFLTALLFIPVKSFGQDTLFVDLSTADSMFFSNNYYLLASAMHVEVQRAQILQAKLYPNPVFTADLNTYDPDNHQAFHVGNSGQKSFQVDQLILLGGKRKKEIEMAGTHTAIAELEFQQLIRELKNRLHGDLYTLGQQHFLLGKYTKQLNFIDTLLHTYELQTQKGNIPLKELVRLRGAYIQLNNDRAELYQQFLQTQTDLQILLQTDHVLLPSTAETELSRYMIAKSLAELQDLARENLPELKLASENKVLAEQYYSYQKRQVIPDINLFTSYDQRGGAFNNQWNTGISVPLPLWNRNQGNIRTARYRIQEADYELKARETEIISRINNSYALYIQTIAEYRKAMELYNEDFEKTVTGMESNFKKRNISLIEFIDFFESYNDVIAELVRIRTQVVISAEQLNLLTGKDLY